jgi:hypothetical protein
MLLIDRLKAGGLCTPAAADFSSEAITQLQQAFQPFPFSAVE